MLALLDRPPFSILPLRLRFFTEYSYSVYNALPPVLLDRELDCILDLGGVSGATGHRRQSTRGVTSQAGPIDVTDSDFRAPAWDKWARHRDQLDPKCLICYRAVDMTVSNPA